MNRSLWHACLAVSAIATTFAGSGACVRTASPVPLKSFELRDVQGLFGGQNLWVAENRTAFIQLVGLPPPGQYGLWEGRYKTQLTLEQWATVERLAGEHDLSRLSIPNRPGVHDEARPTITLKTRAGETITVSKWANDKIPDFDAVYEYLLRLCRAKGDLLSEGRYDWTWRPEGFPTR
jgi:hypothetical protein